MTLRSLLCRGPVRRLLLASWLATAPLAMVSVADAQPSEPEIAKAREQFRQGVQLEAASDWAGALAQFEAVARVKMTPQVRFHIARCQHNLGKLLEALGGYRLAAHEAAQDPKASETLAEARKGIEEVETRIPKLVIERGVGAEAASVTLDGVALGDSSIGKEVPVNPGTHTIEFSLPNGKSNQRIVRVNEGDTKPVKLTADVGDDGTDEPIGPDPNETSEQSSVLPWVAMGVGGASLLTSGVFYLMRSNTIGDHDDQCVDNVCPRSLEDTGDKGKTYTTLGNITLGVGVIGLGVGTIMLLTDDPAPVAAEADTAKHKPPEPRMTVMVGGNGHGAEATLVGTF